MDNQFTPTQQNPNTKKPEDNMIHPGSTPQTIESTIEHVESPAVGSTVVSSVHKKPRNPKKMILSLLAILLIVGGALSAYFFVFNKPVATQPAATEQPTTDTPSYAHRFYISSSDGTLAFYDPISNKTEQAKLDLSGGRLLTGGALGQNHPVVISKDGKTVLYATTKPNTCQDQVEFCGNESTTLSIFADDKETKLKTVADSTGQSITDWHISNDGKMAYYITTTHKSDSGAPGTSNLYAISTTAGNKEKLLKEDIADGSPAGGGGVSLLRDDAGNIYYYVFSEGSALTEHKVSGDTYTSRKIERVACDNAVTCAIEYPQPLSPDGKQLILEDIKDGEKGGFSYYLLDLSSGKTNKLWDFKDNSIQAGWAFWSPDGKQIAFDTSSFGDPTPEFRSVINLIAVSDGKINTVATAKDNQNRLSVLGWSPDGNYLAYSDSGSLKLYDTTTQQIKDIDLGTKFESSSDWSFGWY